MKYQPGPGIVLTHLILFVFFSVCSMEQSVGQNVSMNHAAELDQILASYKVCVDLDCWQSVFLSIFSLKENGTRHGHTTLSRALGTRMHSTQFAFAMTKRSS